MSNDKKKILPLSEMSQLSHPKGECGKIATENGTHTSKAPKANDELPPEGSRTKRWMIFIFGALAYIGALATTPPWSANDPKILNPVNIITTASDCINDLDSGIEDLTRYTLPPPYDPPHATCVCRRLSLEGRSTEVECHKHEFNECNETMMEFCEEELFQKNQVAFTCGVRTQLVLP